MLKFTKTTKVYEYMELSDDAKEKNKTVVFKRRSQIL